MCVCISMLCMCIVIQYVYYLICINSVYFYFIFLKLTLFKYINRQNNHERGSSYMDIFVNRTLYMSCQAGSGIEHGPSALKVSALPIELILL